MSGNVAGPSPEDTARPFRAFMEEHVLPAEAGAIGPDGELDWKVVEDLRAEARAAGLWLPHMPPELGGLGLDTLGMAYVSQELGVSPLGPLVCNCSAPDEGNMHTLHRFGTPDQRRAYLEPLTQGRTRSCFAMTEKGAGADPSMMKTTAAREGDEWVLDGDKWFVTGADGAAFAIVVAVTDPGAGARKGSSMFIVPAGTPGYDVVRRIPVMGTHAPGGHCELRFDACRVPADALLGQAGQGFQHAQVRLSGGRIAHAMRWIGMAQRALDLATRRALERSTFGARLAERQAVQWMLADSATDIHLSRLIVLDAARKVDAGLEHRQEIAMLKVFVANALQRVVDRAVQVHGALGYSGDTPLERFYRDARAARIYDGPDEVHQMVIARNVVRAMIEAGTTRRAAGGPP